MGRNMWHCRTPGFCRTPQITACSLGSLFCSPTVTPRLFCQFLESTCLDIESKGWCWGPLCGYSKVAPAQQHLLWFSTVDLLGLHWKTLGREQQGWAAWHRSLCTPAREGQNLSFSLREAVAEELLWEGVWVRRSPQPWGWSRCCARAAAWGTSAQWRTAELGPFLCLGSGTTSSSVF